MGSRKVVLFLMVFLAVCMVTCRPWDDDLGKDTKAKAEDAKNFASGVLHNAEDKTPSFSESFGAEEDKEKQPTENMMNNVEDVATSAAGTMKSAASGASDYASEKATDAVEAVSGAMAQGKEKMNDAYDEDGKVIKMPTDIDNGRDKMREKIGDTYDDAKEKIQTASDKASSVAHNAKDNMDESIEYVKDRAGNAYDEARDKVKGAMDCGNMDVDGFDEANDSKDNIGVRNEYGRDKVAETFDQAKREVEEAYASAKNTMTEEANAKYEAAKEKASDAAGDVGAKMRNTPNQ
ncbi:protein DR_1172 isoform X3 [Vigna radiata var. radiata]|uniref:Protein DR_1172 isoform X3 n=1 Tax=Vigna radiata var. radiata TaxID=3916 RepID=A0A3Q0FLR4_VIGRR|nr:protein DR_1172 isoform X3 [Vigna radiata var. radiata]